MRGRNYLIIIIILFLIISCSKSVEYDKPDFEEKIVVESYLMGNDSLVIVRLEKSTSPYEKSFFTDEKKKVQNATVKLFFNNMENILEENTDHYLLYDGNAIAAYGTYYKKKMKVPDNMKCLLTVKYKQQNITAYSEFPKKTKINYCFAKFEQKGNICSANITFNAEFPNNEVNYYRVRASYNIYYNGFHYLSKSDFNYFIVNGKDFNNTLNFYMNLFYINSGTPKLENLVIYLDHISEFYYNFREALKDQLDNSPLGSEVIEVPTNIQGGLGIFTCITRDSICADIIQ